MSTKLTLTIDKSVIEKAKTYADRSEQNASLDAVAAKLGKLMTILHVLPIDKEIILMSLASEFKDIEDALQNFSAIKSGLINTIITRNVKDHKKSDLRVMTPAQFITSP